MSLISCHIDILLDDPSWKKIEYETLIQITIDQCRQHLDIADTDHELSVLLCDDARIQVLNRDYRLKDKPTNVLSFPQDDPIMLGDIVVSYETVAREAQNHNKTLVHHFQHMVVHSLLHLLGYDHMDEEDALEMEQLEVEILAKLHIENPYEEIGC